LKEQDLHGKLKLKEQLAASMEAELNDFKVKKNVVSADYRNSTKTLE
jgi:hypothetical protein